MRDLPFVLQTARRPEMPCPGTGIDVPTSEDPLPATIAIDAIRLEPELTKRKTAVKGDMLDGN
jgi:hypothetical protein